MSSFVKMWAWWLAIVLFVGGPLCSFLGGSGGAAFLVSFISMVIAQVLAGRWDFVRDFV